MGKSANIERNSLSCVENVSLDSLLGSTELLEWFSTLADVVQKIGGVFSMLDEFLLFFSIDCKYITDKSFTDFDSAVPRVTSAYEHLPLLKLSTVISSSFTSIFFSSFSFFLRYNQLSVIFRVSTLMLFTKDSLCSKELFLLLDLSSATFNIT